MAAGLRPARNWAKVRSHMFEHLATATERPTAVVVAVQFPDVSDAESLEAMGKANAG